ncbi:MAG: hypothetical protein ACKVQU_21235 [Burkholderiales bacterium]
MAFRAILRRVDVSEAVSGTYIFWRAIMITDWIRRLVQVAVLMASSFAILSGCADMERRYREGPRWIEEAEKQRRELQRQGFPQYSPMVEENRTARCA